MKRKTAIESGSKAGKQQERENACFLHRIRNGTKRRKAGKKEKGKVSFLPFPVPAVFPAVSRYKESTTEEGKETI